MFFTGRSQIHYLELNILKRPIRVECDGVRFVWMMRRDSVTILVITNQICFKIFWFTRFFPRPRYKAVSLERALLDFSIEWGSEFSLMILSLALNMDWRIHARDIRGLLIRFDVKHNGGIILLVTITKTRGQYDENMVTRIINLRNIRARPIIMTRIIPNIR